MFDFNEKKKKVFTVCAIVYAVLILLFVLIVNIDQFSTFGKWLKEQLSVFSPIIVGAIIAYLCTPLVRMLQNKVFKRIGNSSLKRVLSILFAYLFLIGVIVIFLFLIIPQLIGSAEEFIKKMTDGTYLNSTIASVNDFLNNLLRIQDADRSDFLDINKITEAIRTFFTDSRDIFKQIGNLLLTYTSKFVVGIKNIFLGFLLSIYFVIYKERIYAQTKKVMMATISEKKYNFILSWARYADTTFGGFVVGKLIDAVFMTMACSIVFGIAGIPYAILISVIIGITNIIPFFGPFIGAIPSGFIVLISSDATTLLWFAVLLLVIQQFDANILEPKIVGDKTGLTSLGVIIAVLVMSGFFGIVGTFFGVPIFAIISSIIKSIIDSRLDKKEMSTSLADYYPENSAVDPRAEREPINSKMGRLLRKICDCVWMCIKKLWFAIVYIFKLIFSKLFKKQRYNNSDKKQ